MWLHATARQSWWLLGGRRGAVLGTGRKAFSSQHLASFTGSAFFLSFSLSLASSCSWPVASLGSVSLLWAEARCGPARGCRCPVRVPVRSQRGRGAGAEVSFLTPQSRPIARIKSSLSFSTGTIAIQYRRLGLRAGFSRSLRGTQPRCGAHAAARGRFAGGDAARRRSAWTRARPGERTGLRVLPAARARGGPGRGLTETRRVCAVFALRSLRPEPGLTCRNPASLQEGTLVLISLGGVSLGLGETELLAAISYCVSEGW